MHGTFPASNVVALVGTGGRGAGDSGERAGEDGGSVRNCDETRIARAVTDALPQHTSALYRRRRRPTHRFSRGRHVHDLIGAASR